MENPVVSPEPRSEGSPPEPGRRSFITVLVAAAATVPLGLAAEQGAGEQTQGPTPYDAREHYYGMGVDVSKCIGCARCVDACASENNVPRDSHHFRTWVERYVIRDTGEAEVDSPNGGLDGFPEHTGGPDMLRSFFVPKLCNQCANPPCVQVCPVGATFSTEDGVVLVDDQYCIGCRYCIQACPYGARFLHPVTRTASKCTFCYHRVVQGLVPACVEVCPTGARVFGEVHRKSTPLGRFMRFNDLQVLKPALNTRPKVFYANLDGEVR